MYKFKVINPVLLNCNTLNIAKWCFVQGIKDSKKIVTPSFLLSWPWKQSFRGQAGLDKKLLHDSAGFTPAYLSPPGLSQQIIKRPCRTFNSIWKTSSLLWQGIYCAQPFMKSHLLLWIYNNCWRDVFSSSEVRWTSSPFSLTMKTQWDIVPNC